MKSPEQIEDRIINTQLKPRAALREKVLADALKRLSQDQRDPTRSRALRWRHIMESKLTRYLATAAVLAIVCSSIPVVDKFFVSSSLAWGDVVQEMNNYIRYKFRQRVVREKGPQHPTMDVYHLNPQQRRQEVVDGSIHIIDMRTENPVTVELHPDQKKATVTTLLGMGKRQDPDIIAMVKRFDEESTDRLGSKQVDGRTLHHFRHKMHEHNEFVVWVDSETKLPVEIEIKHLNRGQTLYLDEFEFGFDLPLSAFSTEVPEGYEIKHITQDYRPVTPKIITPADAQNELKHRAYTISLLGWMKSVHTVQNTNPLMRRGKVFLTGAETQDGNLVVMDQTDTQGNYREAILEWMLKEELVLETPNGSKLYTHPRGTEYAQYHLESFAKADPQFHHLQEISEEKDTRMVLLPDGTIVGLSWSRPLSDEKLNELVENIKAVKTP